MPGGVTGAKRFLLSAVVVFATRLAHEEDKTEEEKKRTMLVGIHCVCIPGAHLSIHPSTTQCATNATVVVAVLVVPVITDVFKHT